MIFGKIDYINLLPFYLFLKKSLKSPTSIMSLVKKRDVPANINKQFNKKKVEAAVISSIVSKKYRCTDLIIGSKKEIKSVIICPGEDKKDIESNTSNVLAKILGLKGKILIGDKALKEFYSNAECKDIALLWYKKYKMPFVFARFCCQKNFSYCKRLSKKFLKRKTKIPTYILRQYSSKRNISPVVIKEYLNLITYSFSEKEKKSLKKFLFLAKRNKK